MAMDIAQKMADLFDVVGMIPQRDFAVAIAKDFRTAIRQHLLDLNTMTAIGNCQTSQAMAIYYDVFEPGEKPAAFAKLLELVHQYGDLMDVGVLGARVLFHVLARFGHADLALRMIEGPQFPSYGYWLQCGATSLWENFFPNDKADSRNHHFWGDISSFFIQHLAGIQLNPTGRDVNRLNIAPRFVESLDHAQGWHIAPAGKISSSWVRENGQIRLTLEIPQVMNGRILLESGFRFTDGYCTKPLASGTYRIEKI
jgi:alpha-L-rhamnosidase